MAVHPTDRSGLGAALALALRQAVVEPVRSGRPRLRGLPPAVRVVGAASLGLIVMALLWRLVSTPAPDQVARVGDGLTQGASVTMVFWCAHLASHGLAWRLRVPAWLVLVGMHAVAATMLPLALVDQPRPMVIGGAVAALLSNAPLLIGTILGVRRPGSAASVVLVLCGVGAGVLPGLVLGYLSDESAVRGVAHLAYMPVFLLPALGLALAGPVSLASLTVNVAQWSVLGFRDRRRPGATRVAWAVLAVVGLAGGVVAARLEGATPWALITNGSVVVVGLTLALLAIAVTHERDARRPPRLPDLAENLAEFAMPLGVVLGLVAVIVPALVLTARTVTSSEPVLLRPAGGLPPEHLGAVATAAELGHVAAGIAVLLAAAVLAWRGRTVAAPVLAAVGLGFAAVGIVGDRPRFELSAALTATLLGVVVPAVVGVLAGRGRMDERRWTWALTAQFLCALWPWYPIVLEPLGLLAGSHGLAVLVIGLLWFLATEAEGANRPSRHATRAARLLLFCAHSGTLVLFAFLVDDILGAGYWETFDVSLVTAAIPIAAVAMVVDLGRWRLDPDPGAGSLPAQHAPHDR